MTDEHEQPWTAVAGCLCDACESARSIEYRSGNGLVVRLLPDPWVGYFASRAQQAEGEKARRQSPQIEKTQVHKARVQMPAPSFRQQS